MRHECLHPDVGRGMCSGCQPALLKGSRPRGASVPSPSPEDDDRAALERKPSHAVPRVLDDDNRAVCDRVARLREDVAEPFDHAIGPRILHSKYDDARLAPTRDRDDLAEVEIERQQNAPFGARLREDIRVLHAVELLIAKVNDIVATAPQPFRDPRAHAHIAKKLHAEVRTGRTSSVVSHAAY